MFDLEEIKGLEKQVNETWRGSSDVTTQALHNACLAFINALREATLESKILEANWQIAEKEKEILKIKKQVLEKEISRLTRELRREQVFTDAMAEGYHNDDLRELLAIKQQLEARIEELETLVLDGFSPLQSAVCRYDDEDGAWADDRKKFLSGATDLILNRTHNEMMSAPQEKWKDSSKSFNDWASPPGDTIRDRLEEKGWTELDLEENSGWDLLYINDLLNGHNAITPHIAEGLVNMLGGTKAFWLRREAQYREVLADIEEHGS